MGYRIVYGAESVRYGKDVGDRKRLFGLIAGCFVAFLVLTMQFWPEGRDKLEELFLPGDPAVTKQAFSMMSEQLKAGKAIGDAVAAFCQEVLDGAKAAP